MPGADVRGMLKLNAKKIAADPRAFFFAADKGQEPVLYIDRKFDNPKRFGNVKKIIQICRSLFELELSTKTKICAGTVTRDGDGVLNFTPVIQRANAAALKKGLKTFKKQVGRATVAGDDGDESASVAPETPTTAVSIEQVKAALKAFYQASSSGDVKASDLADEGIDVLDRYAASVAEGDDEQTEDSVLDGASVRGKTLAEWREQMVDAQGDDDGFNIAETLEELQAEQAEVTRELEENKAKLTALTERVKKGEVSVSSQIFARLLADMVKVGDVDEQEFHGKIKDKMGGSLSKLKEAVDSQGVQREETIDKVVELEVVAAKADLKRDLGRLNDETLSVDEQRKLADDVAQGKMRLEHAEVKAEIRTLEKKVDELSDRVDLLTDEAKDTDAGRAVVKAIPGGVDGRALSEALRKISEGLDAAMVQLEQAESDLEGCRDKERVLARLRELGRTFSALQERGSGVLTKLSDATLADAERKASQDALLQIRIEVDQNLAALRDLRADLQSAPRA